MNHFPTLPVAPRAANTHVSLIPLSDLNTKKYQSYPMLGNTDPSKPCASYKIPIGQFCHLERAQKNLEFQVKYSKSAEIA